VTRRKIQSAMETKFRRKTSVSRKSGPDRATSKFVFARLDPDGVQSGHKGLYWFRQELPYVQWVSLLLVLLCTKVLVVWVTSFRERERGSGVSLVEVCVCGVFARGVCSFS
jgi:hypothetical protein